MDAKDFCAIAGQLMRCPAVAYHEDETRAAAQKICVEHGLAFKQDRFGNLLVRLCTDTKARPLVLSAHLDHPGFEIIRREANGKYLARFLGGVGDAYFEPGIKLRLMPGSIPARLGKAVKHPKEKQFYLEPQSTQPGNHRIRDPKFAVWELEDFRVEKDKLEGRACDDLIGVAAILATLIQLKKAKARVHVIGVISRAEEVGFHGALMVAASAGIPNDALVVSLETSREMPPVKMGQGVILRVGDRASIFDSEGTRYLAEVGNELVRKKQMQYQRALMSGGTCEATAYQEFGYQTVALCIALGNYHNCGPADKIAAEYVSIGDACGMVDLLAEAARKLSQFQKYTDKLPHRLQKLANEAARNFRKRANSRTRAPSKRLAKRVDA
jgi:putative aminopeptidase FrvX